MADYIQITKGFLCCGSGPNVKAFILQDQGLSQWPLLPRNNKTTSQNEQNRSLQKFKTNVTLLTFSLREGRQFTPIFYIARHISLWTNQLKGKKKKAKTSHLFLVLAAPSSQTLESTSAQEDLTQSVLYLTITLNLLLTGSFSVRSSIKYRTVVLSRDAYFSLEGRILAAVAFRRAMLIFSESSSTVSMSTCSSSSLYSHASWNSFCFVF